MKKSQTGKEKEDMRVEKIRFDKKERERKEGRERGREKRYLYSKSPFFMQSMHSLFMY